MIRRTTRRASARTTGATPNGALFALNAPLVWDLAGHLAKRVQSEAGEEPAAQVKRLYRLTFPAHRARELKIGLQLLGAETPEALRHYCHLMLG